MVTKEQREKVERMREELTTFCETQQNNGFYPDINEDCRFIDRDVYGGECPLNEYRKGWEFCNVKNTCAFRSVKGYGVKYIRKVYTELMKWKASSEKALIT